MLFVMKNLGYLILIKPILSVNFRYFVTSMIHQLRVVGYRIPRPLAVKFRPLTILIEPNTAVKLNLIDIIQILSRLATNYSLSDAFKELRCDPIDFFFYDEANKEGQDELMFRIEVEVELTETIQKQVSNILEVHGSKKEKKHLKLDRFLLYEVGIAMDLNTGTLKVKHEYLCSLVKSSKTGELVPDERKIPFIDLSCDNLILRSEKNTCITEYKLGLDYTLISQPLSPLHYPHLFALRMALANWGAYYLDSSHMREEVPLKEVTRISPYGKGLAGFYYTLLQRNPLQFQNVNRVIRMMIPSVEALDVFLTSDGRLQLRIKERGVWFSSRVVSEGVIKILGLLAVLVSHPMGSVIAIEEIEKGLHSNVLYLVSKILQEISQSRQLIISTNLYWFDKENIPVELSTRVQLEQIEQVLH